MLHVKVSLMVVSSASNSLFLQIYLILLFLIRSLKEKSFYLAKLYFQAEEKISFRIFNSKSDEVVFGCLEQNYFVTCQNLHKNHQVCHARG